MNMAFGGSVSDVVLGLRQIFEIVKATRSAPDRYSELKHDIDSCQRTLQRLQEIAHNSEDPFRRSFEALTCASNLTLDDHEKTIDALISIRHKFSALETPDRGLRKFLQQAWFGYLYHSDVERLRQRLDQQTLRLVLDTISRVEMQRRVDNRMLKHLVESAGRMETQTTTNHTTIAGTHVYHQSLSPVHESVGRVERHMTEFDRTVAAV